MAHLTKKQTATLIELYHYHTVLWDRFSPSYRDLEARNRALLSLQTRFHDACNVLLDLNTIKTKIQGFRAVMSRELIKIKKALDNGDVHRTTYPFWDKIQFLRTVMKKREPNTNLDNTQPLLAVKEDVEKVDSSLEPLILSVSPQTPSSPCATEESSLSSAAFEQAAITPRLARENKRSSDDAIDDYLKAKCAYINTAVAEDSISIWIKSVECDLRKIKCPKKQQRLQITISRLLQDEILQQLDRQNDQI